ncbi:MAG: type II secretion system F family protein [archaeon]
MEKISKKWKQYQNRVEFSGIGIDPVILVVLTIVLAIIGAVLASFFDLVLSLLIALVILDLGLGLPLFLANNKIQKIEKALPDVLHHMSTTLKTGGTVETALKEASRVDYGPITEGLRKMLREMQEGSTFERAFKSFSERSQSKLLEKVSTVIVAARRSGGGLIDTLTAMSSDIRSVQRLRSERRTKTLLQFLFIIVAGSFIAPIIFGIVRSVLAILVGVGGEAAATGVVSQYGTIFKVYLVLQSALGTVGAVQVREGKLSKSVIYIPIFALITYVIYMVVSTQFLAIVGAEAPGAIAAILF